MKEYLQDKMEETKELLTEKMEETKDRLTENCKKPKERFLLRKKWNRVPYIPGFRQFLHLNLWRLWTKVHALDFFVVNSLNIAVLLS